METSQGLDGAFTDYRSDIIILSCYLSGQQCSASESHRKNNTSLELLTAISTLLTTGNAENPRAENVNAVVGKIEQDTIEYLVFAENNKDKASEMKVAIVPNPEAGRKTIKSWKERERYAI